MLLDRRLFKINTIISELGLVIERLYSVENIVNRSVEESLKWFRERAVDRGLPEIIALIKMMNSKPLLTKLGVDVDAAP